MKNTYTPVQPPDAAHCLYLARGFAWLFWGLLAAMLLFLSDATMALSARLSLPAYVLGVAMALWGSKVLRMAGPVTPRWLFLCRTLMALFVLSIYFAPFIKWWKDQPDELFFFVNVAAFAVIGILALATASALCLALAKRIGQKSYKVESLLCMVAVMLLLVILAVEAALAAYLAKLNLTSFSNEMRYMLLHFPRWTMHLLLVPFVLVLVAVWKGRELSHACLLEVSQAHSQQQDGSENPPCC